MKKCFFIFLIVMIISSIAVSAYAEEHVNTTANSNESKYPDLYEAYKKINIENFKGEITATNNIQILESGNPYNVDIKTTILLNEDDMEIILDKHDDDSINPSAENMHYILADAKLYFKDNSSPWIEDKITSVEELEKQLLEIHKTIDILLEELNLVKDISVDKYTFDDKVYTKYTIDYTKVESKLFFQYMTNTTGFDKSDIKQYTMETTLNENNEIVKELTVFETKDSEQGKLKISKELTFKKRDIDIKAPACDPLYCSNFYNEYGYNLHLDGSYEEAIKYYNYAIEFNSEHDAAYNNIGWALIELGRYEEALPYIDKSIEIDPIDASAPYTNKGNALKALEKYDEALECYDKAIEIDPEVSYAYYGKGITYLILMRYDEAIENFKKDLELVPNDIDAYFYIGDILFEQKKYDEALENYDKIIMINPAIEIAYLSKADALFKLKEYTKAISNYDKCIELNPDIPDSYAGKSRCYAMLNNHDETVANLKKAISLDENYLDLVIADESFIGIIGPKEFDELTGE